MELKDKLNEIKELSQELQDKIDELSFELKEGGKKDKIQLLNEYMKSLDERLFVKESWSFICLDFTYDGYDYTLCRFDSSTNEFEEIHHGTSPEDLFNELLKYKYAFKGKYDELFKEEE